MRKQDKHSITPTAGAGVLGLALFAVLGSTVAMAEIPHTFSNGDVADADEVNANFTYLNNRIEELAGAGIGTVMVDCDPGADGPSGLQDAVDSAPAKGLNITSTGPCGPVEIFAKRNIFIDGQGTTTISGGPAEAVKLDIGGSQVIFVQGVSIDAAGTSEGVVVGASLAVLEDISIVNASETNLGVYTGATAILDGVNTIGDNNDPAAIIVNEKSLVLVEGSLTATANPNGGNALEVQHGSLFDQDSLGEVGNVVALEGRVEFSDYSIMEMENGSINGTAVFIDSSFKGTPETGQSLTVTSLLITVRTRFELTEEDGGSATLDTNVVGMLMLGGVALLEGALTFPETVVQAVTDAIGTTQGLTMRDGAVAYIESDSTLGNALNTFEIDSFSRFETNVTVDEDRVTCVDETKVIAEDVSGETEDDLCETDPVPPA